MTLGDKAQRVGREGKSPFDPDAGVSAASGASRPAAPIRNEEEQWRRRTRMPSSDDECSCSNDAIVQALNLAKKKRFGSRVGWARGGGGGGGAGGGVGVLVG